VHEVAGLTWMGSSSPRTRCMTSCDTGPGAAPVHAAQVGLHLVGHDVASDARRAQLSTGRVPTICDMGVTSGG